MMYLKWTIYLRRLQQWTIKLQNVDSVIHCAWYVEPGRYLNSPTTGCVGSIELAKELLTLMCRTSYLGTCFEYDLSYELYQQARFNPSTLYGASKSSLFLMLRALLQFQTRFIWPRLFYLLVNMSTPRD